MKKRALVLPLALMACAQEPQIRELSNVSVNALMAQPLPQFFASLRVANELAERCPLVVYDGQVAQAISEARMRGVGRKAVHNSNAIAIETDVAWRSLQAKYDDQDACEAALTEIESETAVSAVLVVR